MSDPVQVRIDDDGVAVVTIDDGKANALGHEVVAALDEAIDRAGADAKALVVVGRPGRFCAGFDLNVVGKDAEASLELMAKGGFVALKLWELPIPVVFGVTGHALAMGAVLLLTADHRVGAAGPFKIGLNEVRINLAVPPFATELARARLNPAHFTRSTLLAEIHDPDSALAAGFLDEVIDPDDVVERAIALGRTYAAELEPGAFRATRRIVRGELGAWLRESLGG